MRKPPSRARPRRSVLWRVLRLASWVLMGVIGISAVITVPFRWAAPPTTAFILRDSTPAAQRPARAWVPMERIAPSLPIAVVASEDQKFPFHAGFDFESIAAAMDEDRKRVRGASTITQQLAKNLYLWPGRSLLRKALEAWLTLCIEATWPKRRILEVYLNVVEFGPGIFGVHAASHALFGVSPERLSDTDAALLAAVLPDPKRRSAAHPSAYVRRRARDISRQMRNLGGHAYLPWLSSS